MMKKALLASVLATGLILPAKAGVYLPPKPAIVKPENLEFSKHMLLGMPLTMGMLAPKAASSLVVAFTDVNITDADGTSYTQTSSIGTAASDRYVVVVGWANDGSNRTISSCTVGGAATTRRANLGSVVDPIAIFITNSPVTTGTTASITVNYSSSVSNMGFAVFSLTGPVNTTPAGTIQTSSLTSTTISVNKGGAIISGLNRRNSTSNVTFTGLTLNDKSTAPGTSHTLFSASHNATVTENRSVSISLSGKWVACSFNPV
jgi:hypothetical protein